MNEMLLDGVSRHRRVIPKRGETLAIMLLTLAACAQKAVVPPPAPPAAPPVRPATPAQAAVTATAGLSPRARLELAVSLLQQGHEAQAKAELEQLQRDKPSDKRATTLLSQINTPPRQLFGGDSFAYQVRSGDTLFSLAKRYLHDPFNFYGLARFNDLAYPVELKPGQNILIPGHPRSPEANAPVRRPPPPPRHSAPTAPTPPSAGETAARPVQPEVDQAARRERAQRLRRQGLEQMSAGSIDRAVTLLSQAASLDPQNGAIGADLARARRIQATVHSH